MQGRHWLGPETRTRHANSGTSGGSFRPVGWLDVATRAASDNDKGASASALRHTTSHQLAHNGICVGLAQHRRERRVFLAVLCRSTPRFMGMRTVAGQSQLLQVRVCMKDASGLPTIRAKHALMKRGGQEGRLLASFQRTSEPHNRAPRVRDGAQHTQLPAEGPDLGTQSEQLIRSLDKFEGGTLEARHTIRR